MTKQYRDKEALREIWRAAYMDWITGRSSLRALCRKYRISALQMRLIIAEKGVKGPDRRTALRPAPGGKLMRVGRDSRQVRNDELAEAYLAGRPLAELYDGTTAARRALEAAFRRRGIALRKEDDGDAGSRTI